MTDCPSSVLVETETGGAFLAWCAGAAYEALVPQATREKYDEGIRDLWDASVGKVWDAIFG